MMRRIHFTDGQDIHSLKVLGKILREYLKFVSRNPSVCLLTTSSQVLVFPYSSALTTCGGDLIRRMGEELFCFVSKAEK